jgi:hypothetical protein
MLAIHTSPPSSPVESISVGEKPAEPKLQAVTQAHDTAQSSQAAQSAAKAALQEATESPAQTAKGSGGWVSSGATPPRREAEESQG